MRTVGKCQRALDMMCERALSRRTQGTLLADKQAVQQMVVHALFGDAAAGLLETTRGSLAAWIADPQTLKPGNNMPMVPLDAEELRAISAYLASLK